MSLTNTTKTTTHTTVSQSNNQTPIHLLDGGLGTTLEDEYHITFDSSTPLWSSQLLVTGTETLLAAQTAFARAGADILLTATYQSSFEGFEANGIHKGEAARLMRRAVGIAWKALDEGKNSGSKHEAEIALSLGAYGATMQPSQEYTGIYDEKHKTMEQLRKWHLTRFEAFYGHDEERRQCWKEVSYVAFETLPLLVEIQAAREAMQQAEKDMLQEEKKPMWISCLFPGASMALPDGSSSRDVVYAMLSPQPNAAVPMGVGINCTKIDKLESLIEEFEAAVQGLIDTGTINDWPVLVMYPDGTNGEIYNTVTKQWDPVDRDGNQKLNSIQWDEKLMRVVQRTDRRGRWKAIFVGGCCKTSPAMIDKLRKAIDNYRGRTYKFKFSLDICRLCPDEDPTEDTLNAAYAADGYARIKGTPGALVTTYAVGELSAMNGVAGAYAEHAGMIHIVGMTARPMQKMRAMLHHTFERDMDHAVYIGMEEPIRKTHAFLMEDATMAEDIDRTIAECVRSRLPVFIYIPTDVVDVKVDANRLKTLLDTSIKNKDGNSEDKIVKSILELIKSAKSPVILADVLTIRHGGKDLVRKLADLTHFHSFSTPLSKGIIDETLPYYGGVYNGTVSFPGVREAVEDADLVLNVGPLLSDSNTGGFSRVIKDENLVYLGHDYCQIHSEKFDNTHFLPILKRLVAELEKDAGSYNIPRSQTWTKLEPPVLDARKSGQITQAYCWQRLGKFLEPNDIVITDSGTAQFGMPDATFPPNISYITQIFWSSIGYSVGAAFGALVAAKELSISNPSAPKQRVVHIVGEGSLQMTVQEIGSMIRFGFKPVIFVVNNNGYSIERAIWGPKQRYNEVSMLWDHQKLLELFGARPETGIKSRSYKCDTVDGLEKVLDDPEFKKADCIQLCEVVMDQFDYPWRLPQQVDTVRALMKTLLAPNN
ncbi:hypothetical protein B7463_g4979, partial [Scytalidium lignicola]